MDAFHQARELAIVVPVLNERENVRALYQRLDRALTGLNWELIFVDDDSPDGTADECRALGNIDPRVRVLQRIQRSGLASACIEGMMSTCAPYIVVMDGDLQHDERIISSMFALARAEGLDLVVATRNATGGSMGEFAADRIRLSQLGRRLSSLVIHADLSDPMSGFFLVSRSFVLEVVRQTSQIGFKILVDLVASAKRPVRIAEVPYTFQTRLAGESKLDHSVEFDYLLLIADKLVGHLVPIRYALYSLVGLLGVVVNLSLLALLYKGLGWPLAVSQFSATSAAIVTNFFVNNEITYRDRKIKSFAGISRGLAIYFVVCLIGAWANITLTTMLAAESIRWWLAALSGTIVSSVWNYGVSSVLAWKIVRKRAALKTDLQRGRLAGASTIAGSSNHE